MLGESIEKDRMAEARLGRDRLEAQERGWCHGSQCVEGESRNREQRKTGKEKSRRRGWPRRAQ